MKESIIIEMFEKNILDTETVLSQEEFKDKTESLIGTDKEWYKTYLDYFINY